jgi:hypothetical protein
MELHHDSFVVCVTSLRNEIQELIEILIDGMLVLEVRNGFKAVNSGNVGMGWTKLLFELLMEIFPINELVRLWVLFFPAEYSSCPLFRLSCLHVRQCPHNFSLIIGEIIRT